MRDDAQAALIWLKLIVSRTQFEKPAAPHAAGMLSYEADYSRFMSAH
jgi:hypothetical protein